MMKNRILHFVMAVMLTLLVFSPLFAKKGNDQKKGKSDDAGKSKNEYVKGNDGKAGNVINNAGKGNSGHVFRIVEKGKSGNVFKNSEMVQPHNYVYRGKYQNFNGKSHNNRYYYNGKYYSFKDYYKQYKKEKAFYVYQGPYARHGNMYIFSDAWGNEFDMYFTPVKSQPDPETYVALNEGKGYLMEVAPVKYYPEPEVVKTTPSLDFGWGNVYLNDGKFYDLHTSPQLVNHNGTLFRRF